MAAFGAFAAWPGIHRTLFAALGTLLMGYSIFNLKRGSWARLDRQVYLSPRGFQQGPVSRGLRSLQPWEKDLEITFTLLKGEWWLIIRKLLFEKLCIRIQADRSRIDEMQKLLSAWQASRVWVEQ